MREERYSKRVTGAREMRDGKGGQLFRMRWLGVDDVGSGEVYFLWFE